MYSRNSQPTIQTTRSASGRGVLLGLIPLGVLVVLAGGALAVTEGVRTLTSGQGPASEKTAVVVSLSGGLLLALIASLVALWGTWRRMRAWQRAGNAAQATGVLWALAATSLVILLPVLLALLLPQHPAP